MKIAAAEVYFGKNIDGVPDKLYAYKIPPNMAVNAGSLVVIPGNHGGYQLARVYMVNTNPTWTAGVSWKWIVQVVDTSDYEARLRLEKLLST